MWAGKAECGALLLPVGRNAKLHSPVYVGPAHEVCFWQCVVFPLGFASLLARWLRIRGNDNATAEQQREEGQEELSHWHRKLPQKTGADYRTSEGRSVRQCAAEETMKRVRVIDSHTAGEPTRVVISGGPDLGYDSLAERLQRFRNEYDDFRSAVINEPRGSD